MCTFDNYFVVAHRQKRQPHSKMEISIYQSAQVIAKQEVERLKQASKLQSTSLLSTR